MNSCSSSMLSMISRVFAVRDAECQEKLAGHTIGDLSGVTNRLDLSLRCQKLKFRGDLAEESSILYDVRPQRKHLKASGR